MPTPAWAFVPYSLQGKQRKLCAQGAHSPAHLSLELQLSPRVPLPLGLSLTPALPPCLLVRSRRATARPCRGTPRTLGAPPGGGGHRLLSAPDLRRETGGYQLCCGGGCVPQRATRVRKGNAERLLQAHCSPLLTLGDEAAEFRWPQKAGTLAALCHTQQRPSGRGGGLLEAPSWSRPRFRGTAADPWSSS